MPDYVVTDFLTILATMDARSTYLVLKTGRAAYIQEKRNGGTIERYFLDGKSHHPGCLRKDLRQEIVRDCIMNNHLKPADLALMLDVSRATISLDMKELKLR